VSFEGVWRRHLDRHPPKPSGCVVVRDQNGQATAGNRVTATETKCQFINIAALYSAAPTSARCAGPVGSLQAPCCSIASPAAAILLSAAATLRTIKYAKSLLASSIDLDSNGRPSPSSSGNGALTLVGGTRLGACPPVSFNRGDDIHSARRRRGCFFLHWFNKMLLFGCQIDVQKLRHLRARNMALRMRIEVLGP
jgi:hypothetical protein